MTRNDPDGDLQGTTPAEPGALAEEARKTAQILEGKLRAPALTAASAALTLRRCATELDLLNQRLGNTEQGVRVNYGLYKSATEDLDAALATVRQITDIVQRDEPVNDSYAAIADLIEALS